MCIRDRTKADLVAQIAARANMTKAAAERSLNAMLESVQELSLIHI